MKWNYMKLPFSKRPALVKTRKTGLDRYSASALVRPPEPQVQAEAMEVSWGKVPRWMSQCTGCGSNHRLWKGLLDFKIYTTSFHTVHEDTYIPLDTSYLYQNTGTILSHSDASSTAQQGLQVFCGTHVDLKSVAKGGPWNNTRRLSIFWILRSAGQQVLVCRLKCTAQHFVCP